MHVQNCNRRQNGLIAAVILGLILWVMVPVSMLWAASAASANWRFGAVQVTELGGGRVRLYMSLQNRGEPSSQPVNLYIASAKASTFGGPPAVALTTHTQGQRSAVADATIAVPAGIGPSNNGYRLFLQVGTQVTDMMPVEKGQPLPGDMERMRFQR